MEVLKGARVSKLKDKKGRFLTDAYLVDKASEQFPWIKNVYRETSGFIHFSEKHIYSSITSYKDGTFEAAITGGDIGVTEELRREAIDAMAAATKLVIDLLHNWVDIKEGRVSLSRP
ncbi:MAG: hypothetical protein EOP04_21335 [Proteobacteria bacterium]|nr:MAG: hypothetical protein EOP04_21335 [Pseudomonadota bacterium]